MQNRDLAGYIGRNKMNKTDKAESAYRIITERHFTTLSQKNHTFSSFRLQTNC